MTTLALAPRDRRVHGARAPRSIRARCGDLGRTRARGRGAVREAASQVSGPEADRVRIRGTRGSHRRRRAATPALALGARAGRAVARRLAPRLAATCEVTARRASSRVRCLRFVAAEISEIVTILRSSSVHVAGVARTMRLLDGGADSVLFSGDVERLRHELRGIRELLAAGAPVRRSRSARRLEVGCAPSRPASGGGEVRRVAERLSRLVEPRRRPSQVFVVVCTESVTTIARATVVTISSASGIPSPTITPASAAATTPVSRVQARKTISSRVQRP